MTPRARLASPGKCTMYFDINEGTRETDTSVQQLSSHSSMELSISILSSVDAVASSVTSPSPGLGCCQPAGTGRRFDTFPWVVLH